MNTMAKKINTKHVEVITIINRITPPSSFRPRLLLQLKTLFFKRLGQIFHTSHPGPLQTRHRVRQLYRLFGGGGTAVLICACGKSFAIAEERWLSDGSSGG